MIITTYLTLNSWINCILYSSSPPSLPSSQPPTRETSPSPHHAAALNNARTPPPKRWKRSFDLTHHPGQHPVINKEQPLPLVSPRSNLISLSTFGFDVIE